MRELPELPQRLREAADAHRPDRDRMLARVERAMAAGGPREARGADQPRRTDEPHGAPRGWERPPAPWMRVTAVAAAVAGAIGLGGLAVGAATGGGDASPGRAPAASASGPHGAAAQGQEQGSGTSGSAASRGPSVAGHGTAAPGRSEPGVRPGHSAAPPPATGNGTSTGAATGTDPGRGTGPTPGGTGGSGGTLGAPAPGAPARDNGVSAAGTADTSNPYWTQSDVKLTTDRDLTSLTVELRIAAADGGTGTGSYCDSGSMSVAISQQGGYLVFRWTLDPGSTLPAGSYTFAGQFQHARGDRDTSGDSYTVNGSGPAGVSQLSGHY